MLKLLEESGKRFQAFQSEMLEKQLQSEAVEKQKDKEYFFFFFFFFCNIKTKQKQRIWQNTKENIRVLLCKASSHARSRLSSLYNL